MFPKEMIVIWYREEKTTLGKKLYKNKNFSSLMDTDFLIIYTKPGHWPNE